jgi:hypothetical protein
MARLRLFFVALFLGMSVMTGSLAHAMEPVQCIDNATAQSMGHSADDGDQVPADADMGHPHHHGGCHGHPLADRVGNADLAIAQMIDSHLSVPGPAVLPLAPVDPDVRPPIA